jgi:DNA polymerase-3 subunit chi
MTQIDFYTHVENKQQVACILSAKALDKGLRVMIYTADAGATERIDRLLWTTPATGFIPHCRGSDALAPLTPVTIDHEPAAFAHEDVLLNLHPQWPPFFSRFQRLIEIVGLDEDDRRDSRERFRFYRDRGYEIRTHDLRRPE